MTWETSLRLLGENSLNDGALICLLALFRPLIRRLAGARSVHWLWFLVAIHLVLPFKIIVPSGVYRALPTTLKVDASIWQKDALSSGPAPVSRATPINSIFPAPRQAAGSQAPAFSLSKLAAAIWASGALTILFVLLGADWSFRRRLRAEATPPDERVQSMVAAKTQELGLRQRIQTLETNLTPGPVVFGLWRPRLLLPRGLAEKLTDTELRLVVLHELGHLKRGDLWQQAALLAALMLHWFNPLVWLAVRLARADRELACDEFVLERAASDEAPFYDKTLLRVLGLARPGRPALPAAGILETKTELTQRLQMIQQHRPFTTARALCGMALLFTFGAAFVTARGQVPNAPPAPVAPLAPPAPGIGERQPESAVSQPVIVTPSPASSAVRPNSASQGALTAFAPTPPLVYPDIMVQGMVISLPKDQAREFTATHHLDSEAAKSLADLQVLIKAKQADSKANPIITTKSGQKAVNEMGDTRLVVEPVASPSGDKIQVNVVFQYNTGNISTSFTVNNGGVKFLGAFDSYNPGETTYLLFIRASSKD